MPTYMTVPKNKITISGATDFENTIISAMITRLENGFDTVTIELPDNNSAFYPATIAPGTAIQLTVKESSGDYPTNPMFKGIVRFPILPYGNNELIQLQCDGAGYGLSETVCAEEYGYQSRNSTINTVTEIFTDSTVGIIPKYVNKILKSATGSGFTYTTSGNPATSLAYLYFPYKPCISAVADVCDLATASQVDNYGVHWIVTTDDVFRFKNVNQSTADWTTYYGNSEAASTLIQGVDFTEFQFEPIGPEANYIIYNGRWRRPSSGDACEGNSSDFGTTAGTFTYADDGTYHIVGDYGVRCTNSILGGVGFDYPATQDAAWDFSVFKEYNTPNLNFYLLVSRAMDAGTGSFFIKLYTAGGGGGNFAVYPGETLMDTVNEFRHFSYPIGPASGSNNFQYVTTGTPSWSQIDYVQIFIPYDAAGYAVLDGFYFGESQITRIAKNSTNITANGVKMRTITDVIGKDDTLTSGTPGTTDTGLMAQMAKSELLRLQTSSIVGTVTVPMIADALPGQWFHIHAKKTSAGTFTINKDMRATKITHTISSTGYFTTLTLTDDLKNARPRSAYEDRNKVVAAQRPDFQDRQASSIKAGQIDIRVVPLEEDYT